MCAIAHHDEGFPMEAARDYDGLSRTTGDETHPPPAATLVTIPPAATLVTIPPAATLVTIYILLLQL